MSIPKLDNWVASTLKVARGSLIQTLFGSNGQDVNRNPGQPEQVFLGEIANTLGRIASNQTTYNDNVPVRSGASGSANLMERQVERALTKALGRSPGRSDGFISAMNSAFPVTASGRISTTPVRSVVSLYSPDSMNGSSSGARSGISDQLSVEQANLYRQTSTVAADAFRVLEGLQPFDPTADVEEVEALRALVRSEINILIEEFGRVDEPRADRVETYLNLLLREGGKTGHVPRLGSALLARAEIVTLGDETQTANFELLKSYVGILRKVWTDYKQQVGTKNNAARPYSERLSRANLLLPVIADSNTSFMEAMDAIGFTESERRSEAAKFSTLSRGVPRQIPINRKNYKIVPPDITINDLNEWIDRLANIDGPPILADAGKFGLDSVTDQADTLFWEIGSVLSYIITKPTPDTRGLPLLNQVLAYERVSWALTELFYQLGALADQAASS